MIPSYLIAIAIGGIEYQSLGGRVGLMAEPALMSKAIQQFSSLEMYLDSVETYVGTPYIWGQFNIIIVPSNFAYGTMENPLLTFFNAACLTDNKELMYEIIHSIAAQWVGNQVTTQNW